MPPKKDEVKPAAPMSDPFVEVVFFIIACFMAIFIVYGFLSMLADRGISIFDFLYGVRDFIGGDSAAIWIIRIVLSSLSVVLAVVLADIIFKLAKFRKEQYPLYYPDIPVATAA